jgi:hypothetical protein
MTTPDSRHATVYIGRQSPDLGKTASEAVICRHLDALIWEGVRVFTLVPGQLGTNDSKYSILAVPKRSWWWPPMRFGWPNWLWKAVWSIEAQNLLRDRQPDCILTLLQDRSFQIAARIAIRGNLPIGIFVHDDFRGTGEEAIFRKLVAKNKRVHCWCVSKELAVLTQEMGATFASLLLPIPGKPQPGHTTKRHLETRKACRRIAITGALYKINKTLSAIMKIAQEENFDIDIITSPSSQIVPPLSPNVRCLDFFATPQDCMDHILSNCDGMLIPYPITEEDLSSAKFLAHSFPSRLCEFSSGGFPIAVLAKPNYSVSLWCKENLPKAILSNLDDFRTWLNSLDSFESRECAIEELTKCRNTHFSHNAINTQFRDEFTDLIEITPATNTI